MTTNGIRAAFVFCVLLSGSLIFAADAPACRGAQLHLEKGDSDAATSHLEISFYLLNRSSVACSLLGLPFVKLLNQNGKVTELSKPFNQQATEERARKITLGAHQKASFSVRFGTSGPYDPGHCPGNSAKISVLLQGIATPLTMTLTADACTALEVSPLQVAAAN